MSHATQLLVTNDVVTPARTLRATAVYLARHGWVQGCLYDPSATVFTPAACLVGALGMACYGGPVDAPTLNFDDPGWPEFHEALTYLEDYLSTRRYGRDAYLFNDAKGRALAQVLGLLHEAAEAWDRAQHDPDGLWPTRLICGCPTAMVLNLGHSSGCPLFTVGGVA